MVSDESLDMRVLETTRGSHDQITGYVNPAKKAQNLGPIEGGDRLGCAENGSSERMIRPELLAEELVDEILWSIFDAFDLLEDHVPFAL